MICSCCLDITKPFTGVGIRLTQLLDHHAETLAALEEFLVETAYGN